MVKNRLYLFLIALMVVAMAGFTGCRRHSPGQKAEFMVDYVSETLDLNESQKAHLDQIKDELLEKGVQMRADKAAMHSELLAQLRGEEIDQDLLKSMVTEHRIKMEEWIDLAIVKLAEFHKTLTPEQREKLVAKLERFKKWHGHGWE
ncbi:MAG: Spy/CpxP family protein refolding chaperone [Desulfobacterales bacterium]